MSVILFDLFYFDYFMLIVLYMGDMNKIHKIVSISWNATIIKTKTKDEHVQVLEGDWNDVRTIKFWA